MAADIWPTIHAERQALLDDLAGIRPEQWDLATMCSEWNVHQVLAHQVSAAKMTPPKFVGKMAKAGFDFNRFAAAGVARESSGGPAATIAELRACQSRRTAPPGPKDTWLGEAFVHGEDIRRPLGIKREYPLDWVSRALTFYSGSEPIVHGKSRVAGVTLHVTDTDLRLGSGPEAAGPVLSLLLVASGRGAVLDELSGPGVDLLRSRL